MQPPLSASNPIVLESRGRARARAKARARARARAREKARARVTRAGERARAGERDGIIFHLLFPHPRMSSKSYHILSYHIPPVIQSISSVSPE